MPNDDPGIMMMANANPKCIMMKSVCCGSGGQRVVRFSVYLVWLDWSRWLSGSGNICLWTVMRDRWARSAASNLCFRLSECAIGRMWRLASLLGWPSWVHISCPTPWIVSDLKPIYRHFASAKNINLVHSRVIIITWWETFGAKTPTWRPMSVQALRPRWSALLGGICGGRVGEINHS